MSEVVDEYFAEPFVDVDEWRGAPARHRYVHGGFAGTDTRFSIYLPPPEQYGGRFFQHLTPVPDSEHLAQGAVGEEDKIGFAIASGAYFLETNGGGAVATPGSDVDPTIGAYRAHAACAQHSRVIAAEMYGEHRPYGYAYGGSGGGFRTIGCAENTAGVWDGFVPYVIGSPMAIPNVFSVRMHAQRLLRDVLDRIVDAIEPGGSGDMYAGLDGDQRDALAEVTRMGFPSRTWFGHRTMGMQAFPVLYGAMRMADPSYFDDFWTQPGYLGHAAPPSLMRDVVQHPCEVVALIDDREAADLGIRIGDRPGQSRADVDSSWKGDDHAPSLPVAMRLSSAPAVDVLGAELIVGSGIAEGARLNLLSVVGDIAVIGPADPDVVRRLEAGDRVEVDNRGYLAAQTYHRHQVPGEDFPVWDQFRRDDGSPIYPQRAVLLGPLIAAHASGTVQSGRFTGKMIVVESLLDREALPWQADWYRSKVRGHLGEQTDEHFRLWYVDNALHGDVEVQEDPTHTISYLGVLHQALRDVSAWVERGDEPPATTTYEVVDGQVVVPPRAADRGGVQPVVTLTANGEHRTDVSVGDEVTLVATAEVPDGTGEIVAIEWDVEGGARFSTGSSERTHVYEARGTYFPTVRVVAHREGDASTPFARIQNLARARVVVS